MSYINVFCYGIESKKVEALAKAMEVEVSYCMDEYLPVLEVFSASDVLALCYAFKSAAAVKFSIEFLDIYFDKLSPSEIQQGMEYLGVE